MTSRETSMDLGRPSRPLGVLVMSYGTPSRHEDVESFYTDIRRGRPPSSEQLDELKRRYAAVGGTSALAARTAEQVAAIQAELDELEPLRYVCRYGSKHGTPTIEEAIDELASLCEGLVGIVLAPHYSSGSVGEYLARAEERAAAAGLKAVFIEDWHTNPVLVQLLAERVRAAFASLGSDPKEAGTELLVTAHSLPMRIIAAGDGYDARLRETAALVAAASGASRWRVCWQSAGRTPEPWIGPDILEVIRGLPSEGVSGAVICPAGFTSDHLEVNYDLDIEAQEVAAEAGVHLARTASLNADPRLCAALAGLVLEAAERLSG
ncbi:MAG: ferrochelatase [Acidimicrobiales bacterium]